MLPSPAWLPLSLVLLTTAACVAPVLLRRLPALGPWLLAAAPGTVFAGALFAGASVLAGDPLTWSAPWAASFSLEVALRLDPLAWCFTLVVVGVGALVVPYAGAYLAGRPERGRTIGLMLAFEAAMLGLVLADDLMFLFVCWEATSVVSYLLIGLDHRREEARAGARRALLVTGAGGLALLGGLVLAGLAGDVWRPSALADAHLQASALYPAIVLLVLLGAATKSAQVPFHGWLPGAMVAPAPVSALLHAATMVKAGVYLLLRLAPALGGTALWQGALLTVGGATVLVAAVLAVGQVDLKRLLAFTTVGALGCMVLLIGVDTPTATVAAVLLVWSHAAYKGALFMVAGAVEKLTGTRDVRSLGGWARALPAVAVAAGAAGASMAGLPATLGAVAKAVGGDAAATSAWAGFVLTVGAVAFAGVAFVVTLEVFGGPAADPPRVPKRPAARGLWLPPAVLGVVGVVGALGVEAVGPVLAALAPAAAPVGIWPTTPSAWGSAALVWGLAGVLFWRRHTLRRFAPAVSPLAALATYDRVGRSIVGAARSITGVVQNGSLRAYVAVFVCVAAGAIAAAFAAGGTAGAPAPPAVPLRAVDLLLACFVVGGALGTALGRTRIGAVVALGAVGLGVALLFLRHGAPDLALTQLLVEALAVVLLILAFRGLPAMAPPRAGRLRRWNLVISAAGGLAVALLLYAAQSFDAGARVSAWFDAASLPEGHGRNVVNVILVDFRAFDTLGEITVLGIAALGVGALLARGRRAGAAPSTGAGREVP